MQLLTNVFIVSSAVIGAAAVAMAIITDWGAFGGGSDQAGLQLEPVIALGPEGGLVGLGARF